MVQRVLYYVGSCNLELTWRMVVRVHPVQDIAEAVLPLGTMKSKRMAVFERIERIWKPGEINPAPAVDYA
jgi:hypothetical protein